MVDGAAIWVGDREMRSPLPLDKLEKGFDVVRTSVGHETVAHLLAKRFPLLHQQIEFAAELVDKPTPPDLLATLLAYEKDAIREAVAQGRPTVAVYCPTGAYRAHIGNLAQALRTRGYPCVALYGTVCEDEFESADNAYYAGNDLVSELDFIDVFIVPTLMDVLPEAAVKILFVHDIFDSPLGDENEFRRFADLFDYFFLPTTYSMDAFRRVLGARELPDGGERRPPDSRCLIPGGYIRLDRNLAYMRDHPCRPDAVVYAPTVALPEWGDLASLPRYGARIVASLLAGLPDLTVIFRPHPHSLGTDAVGAIVERFGDDPRFVFDDAPSAYMPTYARSRALVTDMSGTAFTYAFTTLRPVVFFSPAAGEDRGQAGQVRYFSARDKIGLVTDDLAGLASVVRAAIEGTEEKGRAIEELRDSVVFNVSRAESYFLDTFPFIAENRRCPDWSYFR